MSNCSLSYSRPISTSFYNCCTRSRLKILSANCNKIFDFRIFQNGLEKGLHKLHFIGWSQIQRKIICVWLKFRPEAKARFANVPWRGICWDPSKASSSEEKLMIPQWRYSDHELRQHIQRTLKTKLDEKTLVFLNKCTIQCGCFNLDMSYLWGTLILQTRITEA